MHRFPHTRISLALALCRMKEGSYILGLRVPARPASSRSSACVICTARNGRPPPLVATTVHSCEDDNNECAVDNGGCAHICDEVIGGPSVCRCLAGYTTPDGGRTCVGSGVCSGDFPHEINGKMCVGIVLNKVRGAAANNVCSNIGGVPVTVDTVGFAQQLAAIARASVWVGLSGAATEGTYVWADGTPYVYDEDIWGGKLPASSTRANQAAIGYDAILSMGSTRYKKDTACAIPIPNDPACAASPCGRGHCVNGEAGTFTCDCTDTGFEGSTCDTDILECSTNNGGCSHICNEVAGGAPTCSCPDNGPLEADGQACIVCAAGFSLSNTNECVADDCTGSSPCQNGGACTGDAPTATCDCSGTGYEGPDCSEDVP